MVALAIVLAVLILLALLRLGVFARYSEEGFNLRIIAGPLRFTVIPKKPKKKGKEKKPKKKKKKEEKPPKEKKGGPIELLKKYVPPVIDTMGRLRRKLRIDMLTVHFTSAAEDPFDAAMNFGRISAAEGALIPLLENTFNIKRRDIGTSISFDGGGDKIYLEAKLTLALWEIIYIACGMLPALKRVNTESKDGKVDNNERSSDR